MHAHTGIATLAKLQTTQHKDMTAIRYVFFIFFVSKVIGGHGIGCSGYEC